MRQTAPNLPRVARSQTAPRAGAGRLNAGDLPDDIPEELASLFRPAFTPTQSQSSTVPTDDGPAVVARQRAGRQATRMAAAGLVLVSVLHVWIASAGFVTPLPQYTARYNQLADAFLHRQTHLLVRPDPSLLAKADPYDPDQNRPYRQNPGVHDAVLFGGKFYLFWGPVPALLLVPVKAVVGRGIVGDQYLVLAFTLGAAFFTALLVRRLWGQFFPDRPAWTVFLAVVVAGLATPMTFLLARSAAYEAAIAGGQFFLLAGLFALFAGGRGGRGSGGVLEWWSGGVGKRTGKAPQPPGPGTPSNDPLVAALLSGNLIRPRRLAGNPCRDPLSALTPPSLQHSTTPPLHHFPASLRRLAAVGACWAAAVGSRVSLAVAVVALAAVVCAWVVRRAWVAGAFAMTCRVALPRLAAFLLPLAAGAVALGAYNHARFGDWREFGQRYQLTGKNYHATPALFSLRNLPPSLYSYAMRPVAVSGRFPFVKARVGEGTFPADMTLPPNYESNEQIAGLLPTAPIVILAAVPLARLLRRRRRADAAGRDPRLVVACLSCAGVLGFAPALFMVGTTQRYLMDLWPSLSLLAAVGAWQVGRDLKPRPLARRVFAGAVALLAVQAVAVGLLLSVTGYYGHFAQWNRPLYEWLGGRA